MLPEEFHQPQLTENSNNLVSAFLDDYDPMAASSEALHCFRQVGAVGECHEGFLVAKVSHVFQWDCLASTCFLHELLKGLEMSLVRVHKPNGQQKVCIEVTIIEGADSGFTCGCLPD